MLYFVDERDSDLVEKYARYMNPHTQKIKILPKNGINVNGFYISNPELDAAYAEGYRYAYTVV